MLLSFLPAWIRIRSGSGIFCTDPEPASYPNTYINKQNTLMCFSWAGEDAGGRERVRPHHPGRRDPGLRRLPVRGKQRGAQGRPSRDQPDILPTRQT